MTDRYKSLTSGSFRNAFSGPSDLFCGETESSQTLRLCVVGCYRLQRSWHSRVTDVLRASDFPHRPGSREFQGGGTSAEANAKLPGDISTLPGWGTRECRSQVGRACKAGGCRMRWLLLLCLFSICFRPTSMKGNAGFGLKMPVIPVLPNDVLCFSVTASMR